MAASLALVESATQQNQTKTGVNPAPLDSWKGIASFFARTIRTVQRWERTENLPIHRHLHRKIGTVYAFESELIAWRDSRCEYQDKPFPHQKMASRRLRLAVLPFTNPSTNPQLRHFENRLAHELIVQLVCIDPTRLGVIARTSVMPYKESDRSSAQIGRRLKVHYILEGSVHLVGRQLCIATQLIDVDDQTHIFVDTCICNWAREQLIQIAFAKRMARMVCECLLPHV
jgi:TolB-like protein